MTKKYRAAALTVAILAAVLAASPAAAQWSSQWVGRAPWPQWYRDYDAFASGGDDAFSPGCYQQPPYVFVVEWAAPTEAPTGSSYSAEYSADGGSTWEDFLPRRGWPGASHYNTPTPVVYGGEIASTGNSKGEIDPRRNTLSEEDPHPYFRGEFGLSSGIYRPEGDADYGFVEKVRGECDGPHAGQFRLRSYQAGEYSADGGLTWVSGDPSLQVLGQARTFNRSVIQGYVVGERSVDNGDGPEAGMHRYRYTRDSSDPQARLVTYGLQGYCPEGSGQNAVGTLAVPVTCFVDVDGSNVHAGNIQDIVARRITQGCGDGRFCPSRTVTRAQMAAFLYRAALGVFYEVSDPPALSDVPADAWYQTPALWAVENDVIRAPGGRFDPGGAVTRADMAEMLAAVPRFNINVPDRAQGLFDDTTGLPDATVRAIEGIRAAGVTAGCATGPLRYCPGQTVTRAQMASFLARAVNWYYRHG